MFQRTLKYLVCQLITGPSPPGRQISHVLQHGVEDQTGLTRQLVLIEKLLQQRLLQRLPAVAPQVVTPVPPGGGQRHLVHSPLGRGPEVVHGVLLQCVRLLKRVCPVQLRGVEPSALIPHVHREQGQDVVGWLGEAGKDVDSLGREVSFLIRPLTGAHTPPGVLDCLPGVRVLQHYEVALGESEEGRAFT